LNYIAAIHTGFDAWAWRGTTVLTWNANNVTLPTYALGEGKYDGGALDFLNGRASGTDGVIGDIAAAWVSSGAGGTLTMDIDPATGRVRLTSSAVDFTLPASSGHNLTWWGFDSAGHGLVGGSAPFVRVAPADFSREPAFGAGLYVDPTGAPASFSVGQSRWWQDPITAMRERGVVSDADSALSTPAQTLEALIAAVGGASVRVGIDDDGHVVIAWLSGIANPGPPTWVSTTFRDRLGFSGTETTQSSGSIRYVTATHPMPGVLVITDGLTTYDLFTEPLAQSTRLRGGSYGVATAGTVQGVDVTFTIPGPASGTMLHRHWIERVVPMLYDGAPVTLYPRVGEVRRAMPEGSYGVTTSRTEGLLYTTRPTWAAGYHGRRRGFVRGGGEQRTAWQQSRAWMTAGLTLTLAAE